MVHKCDYSVENGQWIAYKLTWLKWQNLSPSSFICFFQKEVLSRRSYDKICLYPSQSHWAFHTKKAHRQQLQSEETSWKYKLSGYDKYQKWNIKNEMTSSMKPGMFSNQKYKVIYKINLHFLWLPRAYAKIISFSISLPCWKCVYSTPRYVDLFFSSSRSLPLAVSLFFFVYQLFMHCE